MTGWYNQGPGAEMPDELKQPDKPQFGETVWSYFNQISGMRQNNGMCFCRLMPADFKFWAELKKIKLQVWEFDLLVWLDAEYCNFMNEKKT